MYKKRFAKWGFHKNNRRSSTTVSTMSTKTACRRLASSKQNSTTQTNLIPARLQLGHDDSLIFNFLSGVHKWSLGFFESVGSCDGCLAMQQPWSEGVKQTSFTLKLVSDLLDRGHGVLAGRMARKAFLLVEDILTLEGPALVWNMFEIMYHMLTLCHEQLFSMLLAHLIALTNSRMSTTHPLTAMLCDLRRLVASQTSVAPTSNSSLVTPSASPLSSSSSSPSSPNGGKNEATTIQPRFSSLAVSSILEQAWRLNAKIIFDHFDPRFFQLYFYLHWESCSIGLPSTIIGTAKQWLRHIETQQMSGNVTDTHPLTNALSSTLVAEDRMLQRLLAPRMDAAPPQDYEMLRASSVAALWEYGKPILNTECELSENTATTLRIMPALVKAKFLEASAAVVERSGTASSETTKVSRSQAANVACVVRALMDLNAEHGGDRAGVLPGAIERIRSIVALREYAYSEIDPQVMREMWLLEAALAAAGESGMALEVRQSVIRRLEQYTQDVQLDFG